MIPLISDSVFISKGMKRIKSDLLSEILKGQKNPCKV